MSPLFSIFWTLTVSETGAKCAIRDVYKTGDHVRCRWVASTATFKFALFCSMGVRKRRLRLAPVKPRMYADTICHKRKKWRKSSRFFVLCAFYDGPWSGVAFASRMASRCVHLSSLSVSHGKYATARFCSMGVLWGPVIPKNVRKNCGHTLKSFGHKRDHSVTTQTLFFSVSKENLANEIWTFIFVHF